MNVINSREIIDIPAMEPARVEFPSPKPQSDPPDKLMAPDHAREGGQELCTSCPLVPRWLALAGRRMQMDTINDRP
jgi:hypothetical protein